MNKELQNSHNKKTIFISEYNPLWPVMYDIEKEKIQSVIGDKIIKIMHFGSTSVVGLAAKPIIDIMATTKNLKIVAELIKPLNSIGYTYMPGFEIIFPNRSLFSRESVNLEENSNNIDCCNSHLYILEDRDDFWDDMILLRKYLQENPKESKKYEDLKKKNALITNGDREEYTNKKRNFILNMIQAAWLKHQK